MNHLTPSNSQEQTPPPPQLQAGFYQNLRAKICRWAGSKDGQSSPWLDSILLFPDLLHLLICLSLDAQIPAKHKAKLAAVIAYMLSPFDFLPEGIIGPAGYVEDIALAAYVLNQLLNHVHEGIILKHWQGSVNLLNLIRHLIEVADEMVGSGLWQKLKILFEDKSKG